MDTVPVWALTLVYWLHMLATVAWIGGIATLALVVSPAAQRTVEQPSYTAFLSRAHDRIQVTGWFSLLLLAGTGLVQMSANANYGGFLAIDNRWAAAILAKHLVIGGLVLTNAYQTWGLSPALHRAVLRQQRGVEAKDLSGLLSRDRWLARVNLVLSFVILGLTALARVS